MLVGVMDDGGAFGLRPRSWRDQDKVGYSVRDPLSTAAGTLHDELDEETAWKISNWQYGMVYTVSALRESLTEAENAIMTAALNNVVAVIERVSNLDGRSAAHHARALFEDLVNLADVLEGGVNDAARYLEHRWVTEYQISQYRPHLGLLPPDDQVKEKRRLDKLSRSAKAKRDSAVGSYGKEYGRGWAKGSLYSRAHHHGLGERYEAYRILSAVIHGSKGGLFGVTRHIKDQIVHRTGPDLDLASFAWIEGLTTFRDICERLYKAINRWDARELGVVTNDLINLWPEVRSALRSIDAKMWPTTPVPGALAIVGFYRNGVRRWFRYDPLSETVVLAEPPAEEPDLAYLEEEAKSYDPAVFGGRPLTSVLMGVQVHPRDGARPVPASSILVPHGHPATLKEPVNTGVVSPERRAYLERINQRPAKEEDVVVDSVIARDREAPSERH